MITKKIRNIHTIKMTNGAKTARLDTTYNKNMHQWAEEVVSEETFEAYNHRMNVCKISHLLGGT